MRRICLVFLILFSARVSSAETRLLRYPDIYGEQIVFSYAGDLWLVSRQGGIADRITDDPGLERFPKFSPDGQSIAFTGQYQGDEQVHVVSLIDRKITQLSYYPARGPMPPSQGVDHQVHGWTAKGDGVLFRSLRFGYSPHQGRLFTVPLRGGLPSVLPMKRAGSGDFSADGSSLVYTPVMLDFQNWKHYRGGRAQNLHIYQIADNRDEQITDGAANEKHPMWIGDAVYFVSDRKGKSNLYRWSRMHAIEQLSFHTQWDVQWASSDGLRRIVYQLAGRLRVFDIKTGRDLALSISIPDNQLPKVKHQQKIRVEANAFALHPSKNEALMVARGDLFHVSLTQGSFVNLSQTDSADEHHAEWSNDGQSIAYVSDQSGEEELWMMPLSTPHLPVQLSFNNQLRWGPIRWSAGDLKLAVGDHLGRLWVFDLERQTSFIVATDPGGSMADYRWSSRGQSLAFSLRESAGLSSIYLWRAGSGIVALTDSRFYQFRPVWGAADQSLYFLANHAFTPLINRSYGSFLPDSQAQLYRLNLNQLNLHTLRPGTVIDPRIMDKNIELLPVDAGNIDWLAAASERLIYHQNVRRTAGQLSQIKLFDLESTTQRSYVQGVSKAVLAADGRRLMAQLRGGYKVYELDRYARDAPFLKLDPLEMNISLQSEWRLIFDQVWRRYRDYFYDQAMHGVNWSQLKEKYSALLGHVRHRADLNYLLGELLSELRVSHASVGGGRWQRPKLPPKAALLGAELTANTDNDYYRISLILAGHNVESKYRSPLVKSLAGVEEGDYLLEINGRTITKSDNPYRYLVGEKNRNIKIGFGKKSNINQRYSVVINGLANEQALKYWEWTQNARESVNRASNDRVAYIHLPDMGADGLYEFTKWYTPQLNRSALILDLRGNHGGNISPMILGQLNNQLLGYKFIRGRKSPEIVPQTTFIGPMLCLIDAYSASDAELFAARFRAMGFGKIVGKRSWGGVIGVNEYGPLADGSSLLIPRYGNTDPRGQQHIEGVGVLPDIEVDNLPQSLLAGRDDQLDAAIDELMRQIQAPSDPLLLGPVEPRLH